MIIFVTLYIVHIWQQRSKVGPRTAGLQKNIAEKKTHFYSTFPLNVRPTNTAYLANVNVQLKFGHTEPLRKQVVFTA